MLHACANATKLSYFEGSKSGFTLFILGLFLFPAGERRLLLSLCRHCKTEEFLNHLPSTVSFLVAYMVAYHREYRYRKFQRRRKAGDGAEEAAVGITGVSRVRAAFTV